MDATKCTTSSLVFIIVCIGTFFFHGGEGNCLPRTSRYRCPSSGRCIYKRWICDGDRDCPGGEDESLCSHPAKRCSSRLFQCSSAGGCIYKNSICDGKLDCPGGEDESISEYRDCGRPNAIANGKLSATSTAHQSTAKYTCDDGFNLNGQSERTCGPSGTWSGNPPTCDPKDCGWPDGISNGQFSATTTTYKSIVKYTCDDGFSLNGQSERTCDTLGTWSGKPPSCDPQDCGRPGDISNGKVLVTTTTYQSTVKYICDDGFSLNGDSIRTCGPSGVWSGNPPTCDPKECGMPDSIANGKFSASSTNYLSTVVYICDDGFSLNGESERRCGATGTWSGNPPTCVAKDCGRPDEIKNGAFSAPTTTYFSTMNYTCDKGFRLNGESKRVCGTSGAWSGYPPTCDPNDCGMPDEVTNGNYMANTTIYKSSVKYICNDGYTLNGESTRTCGPSGTWSGNPPTCVPKDCGRPDDIANGKVSAHSTTYLSTVEYTCDDGFYLDGLGERSCGTSGTWSGIPPTCALKDCGMPESLPDGKFSVNKTTYMSNVKYTCDDGFYLSGESERFCSTSGTWSGDPPTCAPKDCGLPGDIANGNFTANTTTYQSSVKYTCDDGYTLSGESKRTCLTSGAWSENPPKCLPKDCGTPGYIANGNFTANTTTYLSTVIYACDDGFDLVGEPERTCNISWSGKPPTCVPKDCGTPGYIANGNFIANTTTYLSTVTYTCDDEFNLVGEPKRACNISGSWSGNPPTCVHTGGLGSASSHQPNSVAQHKGQTSMQHPTLVAMLMAWGAMILHTFLY